VQSELDLSTPARRRARSLGALLRLISVPHWRRHAGQVAALLVAIALGVAAIVAAGNLIASALAGMDRAWRVGAEGADLRVANGFAGVPESLLDAVRGVEGVAHAAGALAALARAEDETDLQLVGFDLLGDDPIHRASLQADAGLLEDPTALLVRPEAVLLERGFAERRGLGVGSKLPVLLRSQPLALHVAGLFEPNAASALFDGALAVLDLPAMQQLAGREGLLDAIDVRVVEGADADAVRARIDAAVAGYATVTRAGARSEEYRSLVRNIRLTLGVPSVMAIVLGAIVIHHAVAVSVSRRKREIDVVRAIGATRRSLAGVFAAEGLVTGIAGTALGVGLGYALAELAAGIVRSTIAGVYQPLAATTTRTSWPHLAIACVLGVALTVLAHLGPLRGAFELASGLRAASTGRARWRAARARAAFGALLIPAGIAIGASQHAGLDGEALAAVATGGDALVLLGAGLLVPVLLMAAAPLFGRLLGTRRFVLPRLGWQGLTSDPGRSATVITSVLIGAAYVMITVGPIGSLSGAMIDWIARTHTADLVVAAPGSLGFFPTAPPLDGGAEARVAGLASVARVEPLRLLTQPYGRRWAVVAARNPEAIGDVQPALLVAGDLDAARAAMRAGTGTIVSRHFAVQHDLGLGDAVTLRSPSGPVTLRVAAIVTDFASADLGTVFVTPALLRERWRDGDVTNLQVWLRPGADAAQARREIEAALAGVAACSVLPRDEFVARSAAVVDAIFTMAYALEVVAALVMIVAVGSFFSMTLRQRRGEIETLRVLGATPRQIRGSLLWEAAWIGLVGSALGCAVGLPLALRMTTTTIRIGGGYTLDFRMPPSTLVLAIGGAVMLCLAAVLFEIHASRIGREPIGPHGD
jgi:putative ABC transport system permease protein